MKRLLGVLALVGAGLAMSAHSAAAIEPAFCPANTVSGTVDYSPGVTVTSSPNTFVMHLTCTAVGVGHNTGAYGLTLNGVTPSDTCAGAPNGSGTITGSGPEGAISGTFTFTRPGIHYYINGDYTSGGNPHTLQLWVDIVNPTPQPCFYNHADILGQGAFWDATVPPPPPPPPPPGAFAVNGGGTISPGWALTVAPYSWTFAGTMSGTFNLGVATCNASFSGTGIGSVASSSGSGSGTCSGTSGGTPIGMSCAFTYTRVTDRVLASGTCSGRPMDAQINLTGTSPPGAPVTSYTATGIVTLT